MDLAVSHVFRFILAHAIFPSVKSAVEMAVAHHGGEVVL